MTLSAWFELHSSTLISRHILGGRSVVLGLYIQADAQTLKQYEENQTLRDLVFLLPMHTQPNTERYTLKLTDWDSKKVA